MMFWRTMAQCKLYNYASHRWVDFKGRSVDVPVPEKARVATTPPKREAVAA
jgi:hypothetical protein